MASSNVVRFPTNAESISQKFIEILYFFVIFGHFRALDIAEEIFFL